MDQEGIEPSIQLDFNLATAEFGGIVTARLNETVEKSEGRGKKKHVLKYPGGLKDILNLTDHGTASVSGGAAKRYRDPTTVLPMQGVRVRTE